VWHGVGMSSETSSGLSRESRHLSIGIDRSAGEVYDYASQPVNLPSWAAGLAGSIENVDGQWVAQWPDGRIVVEMVERNDFGVLDHYVTVASGQRFYNPMRVIADGDGCEVVFTVRRADEVSAEDFERDSAAIAADLASLKRLLEAAPQSR
jgi:hypothetical protein